jgi:hypothetical protein
MARDREVMLVFTTHALQEMKKDGIVKLDIANMLKRCSVTKVEESGGEETWRAEGTDNDGNKITAVVVAYESIIKVKVITAWSSTR